MADYPIQMTAREDRGRIIRMLIDAQFGNLCNNLEFQSIHHNGEERWMAVSWQPMYNDSGVYLGFCTRIRDSIECRKRRDQIRLHAEHLE